MHLRRYRLLIACLLLSLLIHFGIVPLLLGLFGARDMAVPTEVVYRTQVMPLQLARAAKPQPVRAQRAVRAVPRALPPAPAHAAAQPHVAPQPQHRELARVEPHARIAVPRLTRTIDGAAQQQQFEKTIAKLREESNPLTGAQRPVDSPAAPKTYTYDFRGSIGTGPHAEGILSVVKSWQQDGYDYYYVSYWVEYADGTTETGYVPWPIRYPPANDPFRLHWEHFPLPAPLPDFALAPGTSLHPLIAFCLEHRDRFATCPIARD